MKRYLDPKADLTFKKVFGEHPDLVISLLNALLPLDEGQEIECTEYLSPEQAPRTPMGKNSIVDVSCRDRKGRRFIVEMQMTWTTAFKQRVMFNAAKAYVGQLEKGSKFESIQPVYSLNLVNDIFEDDIPDFYHYYRMVHDRYTRKVIDGLHLVFVELPKFTPHSITEKKMQVLWLRFLTEIDERTKDVPQELMDNPEVRRAIEIVEESAFTEQERAGYDKFWDAVRVEKAFIDESRIKYEAGMAIGEEKGRREGRIEGRREGLLATARKMKQRGFSSSDITEMTGLDIKEIEEL